MKIKNPIKLIDHSLKLQSAKLKEKINNEEKYLELIKKTGYWSKKGNREIFNLNGKEHIQSMSNICSKINTLGIFMYMFTNPLIAIPQFLYSAKTFVTNDLKIIEYEINSIITSDGTKKQGIREDFDNFSRPLNLGIGLTYLTIPILELVNTKSISYGSVMEFGIGATYLSTSISQYLRCSDDEGLKNKQKEKELQGLENLAFNN